jgi:hypothetical protein
MVTVEATDDATRLLPQENLGARDGFQPRGLPAIEVAAMATDDELGSDLLKALELAYARKPQRVKRPPAHADLSHFGSLPCASGEGVL